jgi:hypothetical protein
MRLGHPKEMFKVQKTDFKPNLQGQMETNPNFSKIKLFFLGIHPLFFELLFFQK